MPNKTGKPTLEDVYDFHIKGALSCEAYAKVDPAKAPGHKPSEVERRTSKHYRSRAQWHRDAAELIKALLP